MTKPTLSLIAAGLTAAIVMTGTIAAIGGTTQQEKIDGARLSDLSPNPLGVTRDRKEDRLFTTKEVALNNLMI